LAEDVSARYIYALRIIDGKAQFIFDTDPETDTRFTTYELYSVHEAAFAGKESLGTRNVQDKWGNHNSGAIPLFYQGQVVGIVSVDFDDAMLVKCDQDSLLNGLLLLVSLLVTLLVLLLISFSIRRLWVMNDDATRRSIHDALTGLPNRRYLMEYLHAIVMSGDKFALLFVDLDNFKQVNDRFGHDAGDEVLRDIAKYFRSVLYNTTSFRVESETKRAFAARIGGDEFVLVASGVDSEDHVKVVTRKLLDGISTVDNPHIEACGVTLSIGVSLYPQHNTDIHRLLKYSDNAMYQAKYNGKNQACLYTPTAQDKESEE
jgi:diguanylate cyclase (GGDEF)-like protein